MPSDRRFRAEIQTAMQQAVPDLLAEIEDNPAAERAKASVYRLRIAALEDLLVCYRTDRQPSEALHRRLEQTRSAIEEIDRA